MDSAKRRTPFGRPIADVQAPTDMFVQGEPSTSMACLATLELGAPERARAVPAASPPTLMQ